MQLRVLVLLLFFGFILLLNPKYSFALETGFRSPTTCETNGSSCTNLSLADSLYNSWTNSSNPYIKVTFTNFGIPNEAIIDDIQINSKIRTSTSGWTWNVKATLDGTSYLEPLGCNILPDGWCNYNTFTSFSSLNSPILTWMYDHINSIEGKDINSQNFNLLVSQSGGIKNTDIDVLLFNVRYHIGELPPPLPPNTYHITKGFQSRNNMQANGSKFFFKSLAHKYIGGKVVLSSTPDGKGNLNFADQISIDFSYPFTNHFEYNTYSLGCLVYKTNIPPINLTPYFLPGLNKADGVGFFFFLKNWCSGVKNIDPIYLVVLNDDPEITPTPTPDPSPTPTTFLDLPWDYEGKDMSFTDAALSINSFFDHEYPLLGFEKIISEPATISGTIVSYRGGDRKYLPYSFHNGYDYGKRAQAYYKDPVLAAAGGTAEFSKSCKDCGYMIKIDHGNGYQTIYMHLSKDNLVTATQGAKIHVDALQKIGEVGFSGHVIPEGSSGAHIHFEVVHDKNKDDDFSDNILDGLTDPFGWKSDEPDPWENYNFTYGGKQRTGNKSNYLWNKNLDSLMTVINAATGGVFKAGRYTLTIPPNAFDSNVTLEMMPGAVEDVSKSLISLIPTMEIVIKNSSGENITEFLQPITLSIDFANTNMTPYKNWTIFIYSSDDEKLWLKENSQIDYVNKKATVQLNHLTHFALMGERVDTIAPTTDPIFSGDEGDDNWFRSNVELALNAQDNEGGLGVEYTAYRIGEGEWEEYSLPLTFSEEGNYKVEFYSEDNDGNVEEIKTVEFDIDKTSPQVTVNTNTQILWPPNGKLTPVKISGSATDDNLKNKWVIVKDEYDEISPLIVGLEDTVYLKSARKGNDPDGRTYTFEAKAEDLAGNLTTTKTYVTVPHDKSD